MNARTVIFLLAMVFALPALVRGAEFEYGSRPSSQVFDPDELLEPAVAKEISEPLARNLSEEGVDVMVVVLKDIGSAPPEHVARQFAAAWCVSPAHCIVLHVPGNSNSPWIVPAGQVINHIRPEKVEQDVADRERRAKAEPDDFHKVKAAASESADMVRYWMKNAISRSEMIQTESTRIRTEQETSARKKQIAIFGTLASLLPLAALMGVMMSVIRKRGPAYFPNHLWRLRLGAPHAGGNHAVADLGQPSRRP